MFRIIKFVDNQEQGTKEKLKIEERFETREDAKEWIDNDIEPYLRDQDYHFFDSKEGEFYDFCKKEYDENDNYLSFSVNWISYLIKGHE